ncbi:hypothetical protein ACHMW7_19725 [Aminobacter sp. UC22_36]|uniref:hypothetical protein n=1 Tax=Aminobacter sp. UC22_36 TaxID=3374549 RepID=UPI0037582283
MTYAPKIILHLLVSDPDAIGPFVEQCLLDGVSLISIVGENAREVEDLIDGLVLGDGSDASRFVVTTEHHNETVDAVMEFAAHFGSYSDNVQLVRL